MVEYRFTFMDDETRMHYQIWQDMKRRCNPKFIEKYPYYAGRGITVCDKWSASFVSFINDMGFRPSKLHSIDRVNTNGNYQKDNCRWATKKEQSLNRRIPNNNKTGFRNISRKGKYFRVFIQRDRKPICDRKFKDIGNAISYRDSLIKLVDGGAE